MSIRSGILTVIATLALASGGAVAVTAAPAAHAATAACGNSCVALSSRAFILGDVSHVSSTIIAGAGPAITLAPAGPYRSEDFRRLDEGTVATLYGDGILGPAVGKTWPGDDAYEYEYTPRGDGSALCLGTSVTAANGTPVTLQPCGVNAATLWIALSAATVGGYKPLINGSDTVASRPYVLTATTIGGNLVTSRMYPEAGTVAPLQMWANEFGVL